jgi:CRP-like cAMP-binding protein
MSQVPEPERSRLLNACRLRKVKRGEVLAHEGDLGNALFIVEQGKFAIRTVTEDGESILLDIVGPGAVVGEMALLRADRERSATIESLDAGVVRVLTADAFDQLRASQPSVIEAVLAIMAERIDRLTRQLAEVLYLGVDRRIARRIWQIAEVYGGAQATTKVPLTQQDVAHLVGATRPTVNQSLKKLETRGAIELSRGAITIKDPRELARRAGLS